MDPFSFKKLEVYSESKLLVRMVYSFIKHFPVEERYAICDQLRRAVISIPSNLAEGMGRYSNKEQIHFFEIAFGSLCETYSQLDIAKDLGYINDEEFHTAETKISLIARMLSGLRNKRLSFEPGAPLCTISTVPENKG